MVTRTVETEPWKEQGTLEPVVVEGTEVRLEVRGIMQEVVPEVKEHQWGR